MPISKEVEYFAEVMTSRMRSFDKDLGTNNYSSKTKEEAFATLMKRFDEFNEPMADREVVMKTKCVDLANDAMVLWMKLL
jgi:hypothetical protein